MAEEIDPNEKKETKICPHCGKELPINAKFCQKCGLKLIYGQDDKTEKKQVEQGDQSEQSEWRKVKKRVISPTGSTYTPSDQVKPKSQPIQRVCPNCNSIVESKVLEQCPICFKPLPPLPAEQKEELSKMFFTGKKLITEKDLKPDKEKWKVREGISTFINSVLIFIVAEFAVVVGSTFLGGNQNGTYVSITVSSILLNPLIYVLLGIYPLIYISVKKLNYSKLGFTWRKKLIPFLFLGVITGIAYYFIEYVAEQGLQLTGIPLLQLPSIAAEQNQVMANMGSLIYLLILFFALQELFEAILFRGVLHNTIADYFERKDSKYRKLKSILIVSAVYCIFYFILSLSVYYLILNIIFSLFVGFVYEGSNRSLYSVAIMKIVFYLVGFIFLLL